jgi:hypothetical protein
VVDAKMRLAAKSHQPYWILIFMAWGGECFISSLHLRTHFLNACICIWYFCSGFGIGLSSCLSVVNCFVTRKVTFSDEC